MISLRKRVCIRVVAFVFFYFFANSSALSRTLSLQEAVQKTLDNYPELHQFDMKKDILSVKKRISSLRPEMSLELEMENFAGSGGLEGFDSFETTLALSSVIEMAGKRKARIGLAQTKIEVAKWEREAFTLDLLGEVIGAYVQAFATQYEIRMAQEAYQISETVLNTLVNRAARGATTEVDVLRAKASLAMADVKLNALLKRYEREKVYLAQFWGSKAPEFESLSGDIFRFSKLEPFDELYEKIQNSPKINIFVSKERLNGAQLALAKSQSHSDLRWKFGVKHFNDSGDAALTAGISLPLFTNRRNTANVESASRSKAMLDLEKRRWQ